MNEFQAQINQAMGDYDLIDEYFYPLSDDDFNNRYICCYITVAVMCNKPSIFVHRLFLLYVAGTPWHGTNVSQTK